MSEPIIWWTCTPVDAVEPVEEEQTAQVWWISFAQLSQPEAFGKTLRRFRANPKLIREAKTHSNHIMLSMKVVQLKYI